MKKGITLLLLLITLGSHSVWGQKALRQLNNQGNKAFTIKDFSGAEVCYRKALTQDSTNLLVRYNLGNTLYRTQRQQEAEQQYTYILQQENLPPHLLAQTAHNLGDTYMHNKDYAKAVEAFKSSLRINPLDEETRYNLALAQKLLKQQQQQQGGEQKEKEKEEQQEEQKQQEQQKQQEEQKQQKQQEQQPLENKLSKENAEKILDMFLRDEQNTRKQEEKKTPHKTQSPNKKNW